MTEPFDPKKTEIQGMVAADYIFCEDCEIWVDFWKYENLEDAGHEGHNVRNPKSYEELKECVDDCQETIDRCDDENCPQRGFIVDSPEDREFHKGHKTIQESCLTEEFLDGPYHHDLL
ncbi:MAG: hypothetical protein M1368_08415 [Thaumarchaeota archaeon]|nr:hypothetical protein [Nitrososphaerota archaeon]